MPLGTVLRGYMVDVLHPVDDTAPLNTGLILWSLFLPALAGGGTRWASLRGPVPGTLIGMASPPTATSGWSRITRRPGGFGDLHLDGVTDFVEYADHPAWDVASITVAFWYLKSRDEIDYHTLLGRQYGTGSSDLFILYVAGETDDTLFWAVRTAGGELNLTGPAMLGDIGQWVHWVATYDGLRAALYRNGVLAAEDNHFAPGPLLAEATAVTLGAGYQGPGANAGAGEHIGGAVDDFRLYKRALSATEVRQLYVHSRTGYLDELRWLPLVGLGPTEPSGPAINVSDTLLLSDPATLTPLPVPVSAIAFDVFSSTTNTLTSRPASNTKTPLANTWYVVSVSSMGSTGTHTLSGWGITWGAPVSTSGSLRVYAGKTATPATGVLTHTYTGTSTGISMVATELGGDIDPVTPIIGTPGTSATTGTSGTVTLPAFTQATSAALAAFRVTIASTTDVVPDSVWQEVGDATHNTPANHVEVQFRTDAGAANDTTVTATWGGTSVAYEAIVLELAQLQMPLTIQVADTLLVSPSTTVTPVQAPTVLVPPLQINTVLVSDIPLLRLPFLSATTTNTARLTETVVARVGMARAVANTAQLTETVSLVRTPLRPLATNTVALTETVTLRLGMQRAVANTALLTETVSLVRTPLRPSAIHVVSLTETVVTRLGMQPAVVNTTRVTETVSLVRTPLRSSATNTVALTETVTVRLSMARTVANTARLTEAVSLVRTPLRPSATNAVALTETVTASLTCRITVANTLQVFDSPTVAPTLVSARTNSIALSDIPVLRLPFLHSARANTLHVTEVLRAVVTPLRVATVQAMQVTETVLVMRATEGLWQTAVSNTATLADLPTVIQTPLRVTVVAQVALTETVQRVARVGINVSNTVRLTETVSVVRMAAPVRTVQVADTVLLTEVVTRTGTLRLAVTDLCAVTEARTLILQSLSVSPTAHVALADIPVVVLQPLRPAATALVTLTETVMVLRATEGLWQVQVQSTLVLSETISLRQPVLPIIVQDTARLTETLTTTGTLARSVTSALTLTDVPVLRVPILHLSTTATLALTETIVSVVTPLRPSVTQPLVLGDPVMVLRALEGVWAALVSATLAVSETVAVVLTTQVQRTTTVAVIEIIRLTSTFRLAPADLLALTDTVTVQIGAGLVVEESLALTDSAQLLLPWLVTSTTDTLALVPVVSLVLPLLYVAQVDAVSTTDTVVVYKVAENTYALSLDEGMLTLSDAITLTSTTALPILDALTLTDPVQVTLLLTPLVAETLTATDAPALGITITLALAEVLAVQSVLTLSLQIQPLRIVGHQARLTRSTVLAETLTHSAGRTDTLTHSTVATETLI